MTIICDPACAGELAKCCYTSTFPLGLTAIPWETPLLTKLLIAAKIPYLFIRFTYQDAFLGLIWLVTATILGLVMPDFQTILKRIKQRITS